MQQTIEPYTPAIADDRSRWWHLTVMAAREAAVRRDLQAERAQAGAAEGVGASWSGCSYLND